MTPLERSRLALEATIIAAGIPLRSIRRFPPSFELVYFDAATAAQRTQGQTIADGWDWSEAAQLGRESPNDRAEAKAFLTGDAPAARAIRALLRLTKPANQTVVQWRNAFLDMIDANA